MPKRPLPHILSLLVLLSLLGLLLTAPSDAGAQEEPDAEDPALKPGFALALVCSSCHATSPQATAMRDSAGRPIAPYELWQGTMKANSARDPFWKAMVAAEVASTPSRKAEIEAKCLRCHTPMASVIAENRGISMSRELLAEPESNFGLAGRDGVSCTSCHQILPDNLGTEASFDGGFEIGPSRRIFGPHADPFTMPMQRLSSFTPTQSEHVLDSALCGSCHTLMTHPFSPDGEASPAEFIEQAPYLEWRNSVFSDEAENPGPEARSCQDCHLPTVDEDGNPIRTRLAHNPAGFDFGAIEPRSRYGRHLFVGGNTFVPELLKKHAEELGVEAPAAAFDATITAARGQLRNDTASLAFGESRRQDDHVIVPLTIENRAGHKLPSAYPSRRVFLQVRVTDAEGEVLLAAGERDPRGRLLGGDGNPLAAELAGGPIHPHRQRVDSSESVAIWEAVMSDEAGRPTFRLLRAHHYLKDDRLLPRGWRSDHAEAARTAPAGLNGDTDFTGGGDRVEIVFAEGSGPYRVEAKLWYQTISPRFAAELFEIEAPEIRAFERMVDGLESWPTERVAEASTTID